MYKSIKNPANLKKRDIREIIYIIMYGLGLFLLFTVVFFCLHLNNIVYRQIKMLLHARSRIPNFVQSFISIIIL